MKSFLLVNFFSLSAIIFGLSFKRLLYQNKHYEFEHRLRHSHQMSEHWTNIYGCCFGLLDGGGGKEGGCCEGNSL